MQQHSEDSFLGSLENVLVQASHGKRLANYLIDLAIFYILLVIFGVILALTNPDYVRSVNTESTGFNLLDRLITLVCYGLYMFIIEAIFKGRSIGKFITGTKAVNFDGSAINLKTAFLRGISRSVPFEVFSALNSPGFPWHDKWTDTYVIDIKQSIIVQGE